MKLSADSSSSQLVSGSTPMKRSVLRLVVVEEHLEGDIVDVVHHLVWMRRRWQQRRKRRRRARLSEVVWTGLLVIREDLEGQIVDVVHHEVGMQR